VGHLPRALLGDLRTGRRRHLAPGHQPRRNQPHPARRTDAILPGVVDTGPAWGYHGYEYNLALGSLLHDVAGEEAAWQSSH
jgi:hypothetical protein